MVFAKIPTEYDDKNEHAVTLITTKGGEYNNYHGDIRMKLLNTERLAI